ncbi:MAG: LemA family protein [Chitinophagaceae bacterium]
MNTKNLTLFVILGIIVLIGGCAGCGYNSIVKQDVVVEKTFADLQADYQRRADLIPNLVSTVKGEANFESTTLENVIKARASATQVKIDPANLTPEKLQEFQQAQGQVSQALGRLLVVSEQYPNLRANDAFRNLQTQLEGTENRIKNSRRDFNAAIADYNLKVRKFPMNIFAGLFGFKVKPPFEAEVGSDKAPEVKF